MDLVHNNENVHFEQSVFSKGPYRYKMGPTHWKDHHESFKFTFELDDISSVYYAYLSIESWDVNGLHPILLIIWLCLAADRAYSRRWVPILRNTAIGWIPRELIPPMQW